MPLSSPLLLDVGQTAVEFLWMLAFWQVTVPTSANCLYENLEMPLLSNVTLTRAK